MEVSEGRGCRVSGAEAEVRDVGGRMGVGVGTLSRRGGGGGGGRSGLGYFPPDPPPPRPGDNP